MKDLINKARVSMMAYRLAILWFCLFSFNALCSSIIGALTGAEWSTLHAQQKFLIVVAIAGSWTNAIMAFLSKQSQKIKDGKLLSTEPDFLTRAEVPAGDRPPAP